MKLTTSIVFVFLGLASATTVRPAETKPVATATPAPVVETPMGDVVVSLADGTSGSSTGTSAVSAAANEESGAVGSKIDGIGSVLGVAGPGFASGAALASPSL